MLPATTLTYNSWSYANSNFSYTPHNATVDPNEAQLDHHYMIDWKLSGINLAGQTITGATVTIKNIANWDANPNQLFMHLLDTATNAGITRLQDDPTLNDTNVAIQDNWLPANYPTTATSGIPYNLVGTGANNLLPNSSVGNTNLNNGTVMYGTGSMSPTNMTFPMGGGADQTTGKDFVYTFSGSNITALATYIANGSDVALGFDPNCHYWNNGIIFSITTTTAAAGVPEPATLTLLGIGLAGILRRKLRRS